MEEADISGRIGGRVDEATILETGAVQRRGPVGVDWATIAAEAELELAGVAVPDRGAAIERIAAANTMSGSYLRRAISLLPLLEDSYFAKVDLRRLALQAVDSIRRWATYDKPAALQAAKDLAARQISVPTLIDNEKKARGLNKDRPTATIERSRDLRQSVQDWAMTQHKGRTRLISSGSKLDSIFRIQERNGRDYKLTAYLVAGPFSSSSVERNKMRHYILEALGLMFMSDKVVLVCASDEGRDFVFNELKEHNIALEDLKVISINETAARKPAGVGSESVKPD